MTPAEQGQERVRLWRYPGGPWNAGPTPTELPENAEIAHFVPASELEMCQRYFDPMRRSRDEAERRAEVLAQAMREMVDRCRAALDQSGKEARMGTAADLYPHHINSEDELLPPADQSGE